MTNWQEIISQIQNNTLDVNGTLEISKYEEECPFLCKAAEEENLDVCKSLISLGADINIGYQDNSVLLTAISRNNLDIVKLLIDFGADVNQKPEDESEYTILHEALATNASFEIVKLLLDNHADVRVKAHGTDTILDYAAGHRDYKVFELLMNTDAILDINFIGDGGYTPFLRAVFCNNLKTAKSLFYNNANTDVMIKERNLNALQIAVNYRGTLETVKWLISIGFDINVKDNEGFTLLHYCTSREKLDIAKFLIELGLDVNAECTTKRESAAAYRTPLQMAVSNNHHKMANFLRKHGAMK